MSKSAILDFLPDARRKTVWHEEDGRVYIESRQECSHIVAAAKVLAEVPPRKEDGWRFLCAIPDAVWNKAIAEGWLHDQAAWRKWMNNSENRDFNGGRSNVS